MGWLILRAMAVVLAVTAGGVLGHVVGQASELPTFGAVLGAALAAALLVFVDGLRGRALMRWLRGPQDGPAPRDAGFWGEIRRAGCAGRSRLDWRSGLS